MTADLDDGGDDMIIDDGPREDGLSGELAEHCEFGEKRGSLAGLAQLAVTLPSLVRRIEQLLEPRNVATSSSEDSCAQAISEFTRRLDGLMERFGALEERFAAWPDPRREGERQLTTMRMSAKKDNHLAVPSAGSHVASEPSMRSANTLATSAPAVAGSDAEARWERRLLGPQLCESVSLIEYRRQLMAAVWADDSAAVGLAGRLMLIQGASADEVPTLLREIGEAYYRWRPKNQDVADPFEEALVEAIGRRISEVGLRNSLELVRPGDRYDATRHVTTDRGVEVAVVRGWVVLRDNGKSLTKASVTLR